MRVEEGTVIAEPSGAAPRAVRMLQGPAGSGVLEALLYRSSQLSALLVCRAPKSGHGWTELAEAWHAYQSAAAPTRAAVIGEVRLYYALYPGTRPWQELAEDVRKALPGDVSPDVPASVTQPAPGAYLWEPARGADHRPVRSLVLVAPDSEVARSDAWVWPAGDASLRPLPGYLWEMAKVRHEGRWFAAKVPGWRKEQMGMHEDVLSIMDASSLRETTDDDIALERTLRELQWRTALAAADEARLRVTATTVDAALANAREQLAGWPHSGTGPIGDDLRYGTWLAAEIADEIEGLHNAVAYAEPVTRAGMAGTEVRLRSLSDRTEYLMVVQTAAIGSVLVLLTAVQSIEYTWPLARSLRLPFVVVLALVALVLPIYAGRRPTAASPLRRPPRWLVLPVAGLAAATAWLAATVVSHLASGHPAPPPVSLAAAVLAAAVSAISLLFLRFRRDARP